VRTANAYADGQCRCHRRRVASRTPHQGRRRRRVILGVEAHTPTATLGVLPAVGVVYEHVSRKSRSSHAPVRRGRGRRRSSRRSLDLTWAHSSASRVGRGRRHIHYTPRASTTPTANTASLKAVYAEGCHRRSLRRGHSAVCRGHKVVGIELDFCSEPTSTSDQKTPPHAYSVLFLANKDLFVAYTFVGMLVVNLDL
jgi:hypothetical protein